MVDNNSRPIPIIMKPMRHLGQLLCHISLLAFTTRRISALAPACTRTAASSHASIPPDVMHFPAHHSHRLLHSRSIVSRSSIHLSSSRSSTNEEFNEAAYESDRVAQDAMAMAAMKSQAEQEYAKLRTPWKWRIRKAVWDFLEEKDIAQYPRPVHHRIPNFLGADEAAKSLATLPEFQNANLVKVNPDTPQRKVRHFVLESGKTLLTPQPRLRTGFFSTLSTNNVPPDVPIEALTTSKGAAQHGTPVSLYESYNVDLVVVGSTAVCPNTGARVGKGEGFAELEWGILTQQGNLDASKVLVVTTVHDCQVLDETGEEEPWMSLLKKMKEEDGTEEVAATTPFGTLTQHDVPVDIIVTPTRIIRVPNRLPKPSGVFWDLLSPQKLSQIRVLQELKKRTEEELGHKLPSGPDEILPPIAERGRRGGRGRGGRGRSSGRGRGRMSGRGGNKDKR